MFITNNHILSQLSLKENVVKHKEVSKYFDQDCRPESHQKNILAVVKKIL